MIANIFRLLIFLLLPAFAMGQSINLTVAPPTSNNDRSTFLLSRGEVTINSGQIRFHKSKVTVDGFSNYGISPDRSVVGLLKWSGGDGHVVLMNSVGDTLTTYDATSMADPNSFGIYPYDNGNILLRDKIASFTFFDTFGDIITSTSSSSQSKEGETISEVAMSPNGNTLVIYTPKIKRNEKLGSKAEVKLTNNSFQNIFFSSDRYLKSVKISDDGKLVALITTAQGEEDKVLVKDKYGNNLTSITTDEKLKDVAFSADGRYITLYSSRRVMVYSSQNGERLGSTSFRKAVFMANYFPEDHLILAITGDYSKPANVLGNVEVRAINLRQRKIGTKSFSGVLGFTKVLPPRLVRTSAGHYQLDGASKQLRIEANF